MSSESGPCFVTHLECSETGERYPADAVAGLSPAGWPLLVRYDLAALGHALSKETLRSRVADMWRYREFLPIRQSRNIVSLGEIATPLISAEATARMLGCAEILVKDEGRLPTASFKARGMSVAVSKAKELGIRRMAMPTAGNAGAALAAYCSRAGIESFVFCPDDAPETTISEIAFHGAHVFRVNGNITELAPLIDNGKAEMGWFNVSTLKEPYRLEGKKTMGLELAEQCHWKLPDAIFYPTGGGTGLIGMWKAFAELEAIGWIGSRRPRMIAVQSETCAPIVRAFHRGDRHAAPWPDAHTAIPGLRVPATIGDSLILRSLRESQGFAVAISDSAVEPARADMARRDGILLSPEGAATLVAARKALSEGQISPDDRIVLFNCASGLKYPLPPVTMRLNRLQPIDYRAMARDAERSGSPPAQSPAGAPSAS
jgi:threonine synthase